MGTSDTAKAGRGEIMEAVRKHAPVEPNYDIGPGANLERGTPLDITRARTQLGYEPQYNIDAGVAAYREWFATQKSS
jgi:nucleoside-diphosphate-sugar epimerase